MRPNNKTFTTLGSVAFGLCLMLGSAQTPSVLGQAPQAPRGGGLNQTPDPRVQQRTYQFADTREELPYAVFASSKVSRDKKNPLIIALHGLGGNPNSLLRGNALELAEQSGYILVGPMGYNSGGWYGSPVINMGARGGRGAGGNAAPPAPANLAELSEKDVRNVLDMIRKEFNVDENRTYLMGHSMGGAGTFFLGSKYASNWAAIAAIAPAAFMMQPNRADILRPIAEAKVPAMVVQGDMDTLVPAANTRQWIETMKELKMDQKYIEVAGGDHGNVITIGMPDIFAFFNAHTKPAKQAQD
jgi:poly(3-hydroxybutyrate) depolymerase